MKMTEQFCSHGKQMENEKKVEYPENCPVILENYLSSPCLVTLLASQICVSAWSSSPTQAPE